MSQLVVVPARAAPGCLPGSGTAHDLRNLLATVGLHLETLQRLSGPSGAKAADAAHALLARGAALCNHALDRASRVDGRAPRKGFDLMRIARHAADLLAPIAPEGFCFDIPPGGATPVLADPDEVFRILLNLMSNAVTVASRKAGKLTKVTIRGAIVDSTATITLADDGPGLPPAVRAGLFGRRSHRSRPPQHGYGLAIARELAERNGGTLALVPSAAGITFALKLPAFLSVLATDAGRRTGRRAMAV